MTNIIRPKSKTHLIVPDSHAHPDYHNKRYSWLGGLIRDLKPDVVVDIGDWWDMASLCSYDKGTKSFEGRRYKKDVEAGIEAQDRLLSVLRRSKKKLPRFVRTLGNHEHRILKAIDRDPVLEGTIGIEDLRSADYHWEEYPFLQPVQIDGVNYCFTFGHKLLHATWSYKNIEDTKVGDKLVAFDEKIPGPRKGRRYKTSVVEGVEFDEAEVYSVVDSSGNETTVTADHLWLVKQKSGYGWCRTSDLGVGTEIVKPFSVWEREETYEMGYLGGILDGEGWVSKPNTKQGGIQVGFAQNQGLVLNKCMEILDKNGYKYTLDIQNKCYRVRLLGNSDDKISLLVRAGAVRLLSRLKPEDLGRMQKTSYNPKVVSITKKSVEPIVKIKTSTGTLIVDGAAHHNCHYFTTGVMGRPISGETPARSLILKQFASCTMGHVHTFDYHCRTDTSGRRLHGLVGGVYQDYWADYAGPANNLWRAGVTLKTEVSNGDYNIRWISLDAIREAYKNERLHGV